MAPQILLQPKDLESKIADILTIPSLSSYSRALLLVEEMAEFTSSSTFASLSSPNSPTAMALRQSCTTYQTFYNEAINDLVGQASALERDIYRRRRVLTTSLGKHRRREMEESSEDEFHQQKKRCCRDDGVVELLNVVDRGVRHITTALGSLTLEKEFPKKRELSVGEDQEMEVEMENNKKSKQKRVRFA